MSIRDTLINRIASHLLTSQHYADFLHAVCDKRGDDVIAEHTKIVEGINRANDAIILSVYDAIMQGRDIIPYHVHPSGNYCDVRIGRHYGGIVDDGSIHA